MSVDQLAALGVHLDQAPDGRWFVSRYGWGRPVSRDHGVALAYARSLV